MNALNNFSQSTSKLLKIFWKFNNLSKVSFQSVLSFTVGEYIVPSLMKSMQSAYPEVEFDITIGNTDEIIQLVQQLDVDLGLIEGQTSSKDLHVEPFMEDELFIVAAPNHPLSKKETVMIDDLQDQVWISREEGSVHGSIFPTSFDQTAYDQNLCCLFPAIKPLKKALLKGWVYLFYPSMYAKENWNKIY